MPCAGVENLEICDRPMPCSVHGLFMGVYAAMNETLGATTLADAAADAGGPPYPTAVRRRRLAQHAALVTRTDAVRQAAARPAVAK
jgi:DNA-binding IscR family transcriptional regulator